MESEPWAGGLGVGETGGWNLPGLCPTWAYSQGLSTFFVEAGPLIGCNMSVRQG